MTPLNPGDPVVYVDTRGQCQAVVVESVQGSVLLFRTVFGYGEPVGLQTLGHQNALEDEGVSWVRGHTGEIPDAFRARVLLVGPPAAQWIQRDGVWLCTRSGVGGTVGNMRLPGQPGTRP